MYCIPDSPTFVRLELVKSPEVDSITISLQKKKNNDSNIDGRLVGLDIERTEVQIPSGAQEKFVSVLVVLIIIAIVKHFGHLGRS